MNHLLLGTAPQLDKLLACADTPFLLIDDGPLIEAFQTRYRAKIFDPRRHSIDLYKGLDHRRAKAIAHALYSSDPEAGKSTLTVRNGRRALARMLNEGKTLTTLDRDTKDSAVAEAVATVDDALLSPVLRRVLCGAAVFELGPASIVAKLDRAELGDEDALVLGLLLLTLYKGHVIVSDGGFYLRPLHMSLIRQERLTARVRSLSELPKILRQAVLTAPVKHGAGCTHEDALELARAEGLIPGVGSHTSFVQEIMGL